MVIKSLSENWLNSKSKNLNNSIILQNANNQIMVQCVVYYKVDLYNLSGNFGYWIDFLFTSKIKEKTGNKPK